MNGNKSFLHAKGPKLCSWLVVGQLCFKVSWSYLPISSYVALTNKTKIHQHLIWSFQTNVSTIFKMKKTSILYFKMMFCFGNYLHLRTSQGKIKWNYLLWSKINLYLFPVLLNFFFSSSMKSFLLLLLDLWKTEWWVPQPTWFCPPKQKEVSLQGKGIVHDNNSEFIRMQPGIPMKSQLRHHGCGMSAMLAGRGRRGPQTSPSSTAHYPAWVSQPA